MNLSKTTYHYTPLGIFSSNNELTSDNTAKKACREVEYRFNGKELDQETGLAYYGARYYDNQLSMWLSVDPLAMKDDNVTRSPYNFTDNNPVMLFDPDGRNAWKPDGKGGWIAESGDGAETLARDAGISRREAYALMDQQGYGTYNEDGLVKSAVDAGDIVVVPLHKRRYELKQERQSLINEQIDAQEALIEVNNEIAVMLFDERESLRNQVRLSSESNQYSPDSQDPKGGIGTGTGSVNTAKELRIEELSSQIKTVLSEIERLKTSNEELRSEIE